MNNLLKIFLIFNLIPAIAPNNYSIPLPETELQMGQNSSEIVKRDGSINLVGGTRVATIVSTQQKELTLSFPAVRKLDGKKGFLVPFGGGNYFVGDKKIGDDDGESSSLTFSPSEGIAYEFLVVYPEFWSDENSPNVLYNECDNTGCKTVSIPLLSTPNQDQLPLKTTVCAYGGASGYVCGEIVDFNATITSYSSPIVPAGFPFHPVTKVSMNKPCLEGDMGAPVYIPTNVPNSKQIVANAVGQVISDDKDSEVNMWYYFPLKKVFDNANLPGRDGLELAAVGGNKEPIILHGGTTIWGILTGTPGSAGLERPCTLSFPVKTKEGHLGFLTSYTCSDGDFFVKDANGNLVKVGKFYPPNAFVGSAGLDNTFVLVYKDYWSDETSKNMLYSPQCGENKLLPIIPTADKTLVPISEVCAFGGLHGEMVCGEILEFDVTIQVPGIEGSFDFNHVVKVNMSQDYDLGYLGAPVYISLQIPDSDEFVADPVGQIVETFAQNKNEENQDKKIWYYIPLDRILQAGGLNLLSSLVPENPSSKQDNFSSSDDLTMSSNTSEVVPNHLDKRQVVIIRAGRLIGVSRAPGELRDTDKRCTLGFPVSREGGENQFDRGFLTLGNCLSTNVINNLNGIFLLSPLEDPLIDQPRIGTARTSDLVYRWFSGLDFAIARLLPGNIFNLRVKIPSYDDPAALRMADIINEAYFPPLGTRVCTTAGYSRIVCGVVTSTNAGRSVINPWTWRAFLGAIGLGVSPLEYWRNLIKVRLENAPRAWNENKKDYDRGSPVYWIEQNDATGARVRPVGILFNYDFVYEEVGDRCERVWYMYCVSVNLIMLNYGPGLRLLGRNP